MLSKREPKTNHQAHSMVTLSSPRRLLLRPLFLRRLPLHHYLLRPVLLERGHHQLPNDQRFLGRGILDVFCSCSMVRLAPIANASRMSREHWEAANVMQILKAGVLYFALVFGAGFALGTVRTLWIVPRVGTRRAELMETPLMLVVTIVAARWIVLHFAVPSTPSSRLGMGCIALVLLLLAEF